jgi:CHAT domain-containing protein
VDVREMLDEYVGLPTSFLAAGVPAVVSSLWAVEDLSTMLLMERFYRHHLREGLHPREALRSAQFWLRDVTCGELADRFEAERKKPEGERVLPYEKASAAWRFFAPREPSERPYAHPRHWAAFLYAGA